MGEIIAIVVGVLVAIILALGGLGRNPIETLILTILLLLPLLIYSNYKKRSERCGINPYNTLGWTIALLRPCGQYGCKEATSRDGRGMDRIFEVVV